MEIDVKLLRRTLEAVSGIARKNSPAVHLQDVRITFYEDSMSFYCTDGECCGEATCEAQPLDLAGREVMVNCHKLLAAVKKLDSDSMVAIKSARNKLVLSQSQSRFQIPVNTGRMPEMIVTEGDTVHLPANEVFTGVKLVITSCAETKYNFTRGVVFRMEGEKLWLAATTITRGAYRECIVTTLDKKMEKREVCIPSWSLESVVGAFFRDDTVEMTIGTDRVVMRMTNLTVSMPLLSGHILDWMSAFHEGGMEIGRQAKVMIGDLKSAIDKLRLMTSKESLGATLRFAEDSISFETDSDDGDGNAWAETRAIVSGDSIEFDDDASINTETLAKVLQPLPRDEEVDICEASQRGNDVFFLRCLAEDWGCAIATMSTK